MASLTVHALLAVSHTFSRAHMLKPDKPCDCAYEAAVSRSNLHLIANLKLPPHLINSRLVNSFAMPNTHFRFRKSHGGRGLEAGITSHVKRSGQDTSSAAHLAFSYGDLRGQSATIVVEENPSPHDVNLTLTSQDKNDLRNFFFPPYSLSKPH